jgi:undecaprenyl-diphosphatase
MDMVCTLLSCTWSDTPYHVSHMRNIENGYILAELPILLIVVTVAGFLYLIHAPFVLWFVIYGGAVVIWTFSQTIKYLMQKPRPSGSYKTGFSFPSGHTTFMLTLSLLFLPVSVGLGATLSILALISGGARVYVGVHRLGDILGSVMLSLVGVVLIQQLIGYIV